MAKDKTCAFCKKEVKSFWKAKTRDRDPCCKNCLPLYFQKYEAETKKNIIRSPNTRSSELRKSVFKIGNKSIKKISDKQLKKLEEYRPLRDKYLKDHPECEIKSPVCTGATTELHHKRPRRYHLSDVSVFCASCRACNSFVESHHEWARERSFKIDHL